MSRNLRERLAKEFVRQWSIPLLAVILAMLVGFVIITATSGLQTARTAYLGLITGAVGNPRALAETLVASTPYILAGLAVALGFQCGLFNIGAEGQLYMGALAAAVVGYSVSLPMALHLPLAILAGTLAGAAWGAIPGWLKARTGGHEVINTIMLNYIAVALVDYLVKNPLRESGSTIPRTPYIQESAHLPYLVSGFRLHAGFIGALFMAGIIAWFLTKTIYGYEIRTVGLNPGAARYAGMNVAGRYVLTMAMAGGLAGLAGVGEVLGLNHTLPAAFSSGYGFDSIAVALLARSRPLAVIPAAILWGALRNGAGLMQLRSGISIDLVNIMQAVVIIFVAAEVALRKLLHIKTTDQGPDLARGWGK